MEHEEVLKRRILEYIRDNDGVTWFISEGFERFIEEDAIQTLLFRVVMQKVNSNRWGGEALAVRWTRVFRRLYALILLNKQKANAWF